MREEYERIKDEVHQSITHTNAISLGDLNGENDRRLLLNISLPLGGREKVACLQSPEVVALSQRRTKTSEYGPQIENH